MGEPTDAKPCLTFSMDDDEVAPELVCIEDADSQDFVVEQVVWDQSSSKASLEPSKNVRLAGQPVLMLELPFDDDGRLTERDDNWQTEDTGAKQIGSGLQASGLLSERLCALATIRVDESTAEPDLALLEAGLPQRPSEHLDWIWHFNPRSSGWFRVGVSDANDQDLQGWAKDALDGDLLARLRVKQGICQTEHRQQHHFHQLERLNEETTATATYTCCQCPLAIYYDTKACQESCIPTELLTSLQDRGPAPGDSLDPAHRATRSLSYLKESVL